MKKFGICQRLTLNRFLLLLLAFALVFLTSCFDVDSRLELRNNGSGHLKIVTRFPEGESCAPDKSSTEKSSFLFMKDTPRAQARKYSDKKHCVVNEEVSFRNLSELKLESTQFQLEKVDDTGSGKGQARLRVKQFIPAMIDPSKDNKEFLNQLKGFTFSSTITVPGKIEKASSVEFGKIVIKPRLSKNTARWKIPLDQLAYGLQMEVTFLGSGTIKGASSTFPDNRAAMLTDNSSWPLHPLIRGDWTFVGKEAAQQILDQLRKVMPKEEQGMLDRVNRIRKLSLSFYPDGKLYEAETTLSTGEKGLLTFLRSGKHIVTLNGQGSSIAKFNRAVSLNLSSPEQAKHYLSFFSTALYDKGGRFILTQSIDDLPLLKDATGFDFGALRNKIKPIEITSAPKISKDGKKAYQAKAFITYSQTMYLATFVIGRDGSVKLTDEAVVAQNVPLQRDRFEGSMRIAASAEEATAAEFTDWSDKEKHRLIEVFVAETTRHLLSKTTAEGDRKGEEEYQSDRSRANLVHALFSEDESQKESAGTSASTFGFELVKALAKRQTARNPNAQLLDIIDDVVSKLHKQYYTKKVRAWLPKRSDSYQVAFFKYLITSDRVMKQSQRRIDKLEKLRAEIKKKLEAMDARAWRLPPPDSRLLFIDKQGRWVDQDGQLLPEHLVKLAMPPEQFRINLAVSKITNTSDRRLFQLKNSISTGVGAGYQNSDKIYLARQEAELISAVVAKDAIVRESLDEKSKRLQSCEGAESQKYGIKGAQFICMQAMGEQMLKEWRCSDRGVNGFLKCFFESNSFAYAAAQKIGWNPFNALQQLEKIRKEQGYQGMLFILQNDR